MALKDQLDKIKEQEWYQQAKASYAQLSPEQQTYVKWGSFGAAILLFCYFTWNLVSLSNGAKKEYFEKQELSLLVTQASDEVRRLKGQNSGFSQGGSQNWNSVFQNLATQQGIASEAIQITNEAPGASQNVIQESLLQVSIKGAMIRPLVQFLYQVEHSSPPMKLKGMKIDATSPDGLLTAALNISGYMAKPEKGEKSK